MKKFMVGLVLGLTIGSVASAYAAGCFGTGWAVGWTVIDDDDNEICSDPYVWAGTREIECDD